MVSYDSSQIALYLALVLTVASIGLTLAVGVLTEAVVRHRSARHTRHETLRAYYGRVAFHH